MRHLTKLKTLSLVGIYLLQAGLLFGQSVEVVRDVRNISWGELPDVSNPGIPATSGQFSSLEFTSSAPAFNPSPLDTTDPISGNLVQSNNGVLVRSFFGGSFSGSVPDYFFGDIIPTPDPLDVTIDGELITIEFRAEPVRLSNDGNEEWETWLNWNENDPIPFAFPDDYNERYYWSPHAEAIFASNPGRITLYWRSLNRVGIDPNTNQDIYYFTSETYGISAGSATTPSRIYWTESRFSGPAVAIPSGTIQEVRVVYNEQVPDSVPDDEIYIPEGGSGVDSTEEVPLTDRTLWYDFTQGVLRAYNVEGRLLVEYLGQSRDSTDASIREHLGIEVVDIIQEATPVTLETYLGERLLPSDGRSSPSGSLSPDGKRLFDPADYTAQAVTTIASISTQYTNSHIEEGIGAFYAVRENDFAAQVQIYWLAPSAVGGLGIEWPALLNYYDIGWPTQIDGYYALNARPDNADLVDITGIPLLQQATPELLFQDDPAQEEAELDGNSELIVSFDAGRDTVNRSLVLLNTGTDFWYLRVYSYLETNHDDLRSAERDALVENVALLTADLAADPDNLDLQNELAEATDRLFRFDQFEDYHIDEIVAVGERINAPVGAQSLSGYISEGSAYNPNAYIDPQSSGVEAAEDGAIIPVNARPGHDELVVWWYRRFDPPTDAFQPIYFPSHVGRYTIVWPGQEGTSDVPSIVLASGLGTGDVHTELASGNLYYQNNPSLPGYNPNEEHALALGSRFYALRDDLAVYGEDDALISSEPYVLVEYTAASDDRPAMQLYRVEREDSTHTFEYEAIAGRIIQPPAPLSLLPIPLLSDGTSRNTENTPADLDPALEPGDDGLPHAYVHYDRFTFEDRKGNKWLYRGPHQAGSAGNLALSLKFYYNTIDGFAFPGSDGIDQAPPVGTIVPFLRPLDGTDGFVGDSITGEALSLAYTPYWPDSPNLPEAQQETLPELRYAETLTLPKFGLPQVRGATSLQIVYQGSIAQNVEAELESAVLHDPTRAKVFLLSSDSFTDLPASIATTSYQGNTWFQRLPPHLQERFYFDPNLGDHGGLVFRGEFVNEITGEDYLLINVLGDSDVSELLALVDDADADAANWAAAINGLATTLETFREDPDTPGVFIAESSFDQMIGGDELAVITDPDTAVDSYALTAVGGGNGYVTLLQGNGNAFTPEEEPVSMQIIRVDSPLYTGEVKPITPSNPLGEQVTLQHTGEFAGRPEGFEFDWRYLPPENGQPPLAPNEENAPDWIPLTPVTQGLNRTVFGGNLSPLLTMSDNYVVMRYRPLEGHSLYPDGGYADDESGWSEWTNPALAEGWIKRVLAGINPFSQRVSDFFNNTVNTDVSVLTQAGTRWEGDVALNLDNIDEAGLIEIYETVLNRGVSLSIDGNPPVDYGPANDALLLAAGYLADLYQILGDEAFADASNPLIHFDVTAISTAADPSLAAGFEDFFRETATARFAFEGQVASLIDEELTLLRGRDDFLTPGVEIAPAYNRFYWNYTRGIDAGEVIYALNYNIREKQEAEADGRIDAIDAARQYPQGHGDAYGHYLTALSNYYRLLTDAEFSWAPRVEAVNILGVPVTVDYLDERKFATAAVGLARAGKQITSLVQRQAYTEDAAGGWEHLRDGRTNGSTGRTRHWGHDEWTTRAAQGSYFNWIVANALLPEEDTTNEGVQKIDRTTVPELDELSLIGEQFQRQADEASLFVNPLGLTSNSLLFDISPSELSDGKTHFEQIYERAVAALDNADAVFQRAADSTTLLRLLENQGDDLSKSIFDQEFAFNVKLIDLYGTPYAGDIGPGKTYSQDYDGPDLTRYMYIDRPDVFVDRFGDEETFTITVPSSELDDGLPDLSDPNEVANLGQTIAGFFGFADGEQNFELLDDAYIERFSNLFSSNPSTEQTFTVNNNSLYQFVDDASLGSRENVGKIQTALLDFAMQQDHLLHQLERAEKAIALLDTKLRVLEEIEAFHTRYENIFDGAEESRQRLAAVKLVADLLKRYLEGSIATTKELAAIAVEGFPKVVGFSNDLTSVGRVGVLLGAQAPTTIQRVGLISSEIVAKGAELSRDGILFNLPRYLTEAGFPAETARYAAEIEASYNELTEVMDAVNNAAFALQSAEETYVGYLYDGQIIQREREIIRKRTAAIAQGYRTRDVAFRAFRTEALEQYQLLLDWAARYAYLTAKAYDYETGLLGTASGQNFLNQIVQSRALGLLDEDGNPQIAGSGEGDPGLTGLLKRLDGDWSVVDGRLGFNNPDTYGTVFSLRSEHFRIPETEAGDDSWQQTLETAYVDDLRTDPDVAAHALQLDNDSGLPVPGLIITFATTIENGVNFFGRPLAAGDATFTPSSFATKIRAAGIVFDGYLGIDPTTRTDENALSATPYVYLLPTGSDVMRTPPLGDGSTQRLWQVHDHALPLPYNIGDNAFSDVDYWTSASSLTEPFFQPRKHQAFRAVDSPAFFFGSIPEDYTNSRLIGRSVWNTQWKLIIPADTLLNDPTEGLDRFIETVSDIQLFLKTYSYSGN